MSELSLAGRGAIITGGSVGLGYTIAETYVRHGANIMICARTATEVTAARDRLARLTTPRQVVAAMPADVSTEADIDKIVSTALATFPSLEILVNNAAIVGPIGPAEDADWQKWRHTTEVNLFGSVLMCRAVVPHFRRQKYGKILQLSAGGATAPDPRFSAYAASKAAAVAFAATLAEELRDDSIDVNSIAPGGLTTRMNDEKLAAGTEKLGDVLYQQLQKRKKEGGTPLAFGAELAVFLGAAASDGITGRIISAVWDEWRTLADHRDKLSDSDVYTLRRIVPRDRGFSWSADS